MRIQLWEMMCPENRKWRFSKDYMSKVQKICLVIACAMIVLCGVMLFVTAREYKVAENEYDDLQKFVSKVSTASLSEGGIAQAAVETTETVMNEVEEVDPLPRNYNRSDFPDIEIDFDGLREINPETVAWLYVGGPEISYPVVQGKDNDYYLHNTFENKKNSSGSIFMDWEVKPDLSSWNTFIYGHNMKNGSMFGHLKDFIRNANTYDKDKYIYVFVPEGIYRYEIFSYYLDKTDSKMYYTCDNFKEYRAYLREATRLSVRECEAKAPDDRNIVTLVTCSGSGAAKQRFFVHGTFIDRYLYE